MNIELFIAVLLFATCMVFVDNTRRSRMRKARFQKRAEEHRVNWNHQAARMSAWWAKEIQERQRKDRISPEQVQLFKDALESALKERFTPGVWFPHSLNHEDRELRSALEQADICSVMDVGCLGNLSTWVSDGAVIASRGNMPREVVPYLLN